MILVEANAWFNNAIRAYSPGGWLAFPASLG